MVAENQAGSHVFLSKLSFEHGGTRRAMSMAVSRPESETFYSSSGRCFCRIRPPAFLSCLWSSSLTLLTKWLAQVVSMMLSSSIKITYLEGSKKKCVTRKKVEGYSLFMESINGEHTFRLSTHGGTDRWIPEFKTSRVYTVNPKPARAAEQCQVLTSCSPCLSLLIPGTQRKQLWS